MLRAILALFALVIASPAGAQPAEPGEAAYQEGRQLYDLREWDKAIAKFKEAYRLRSDAASLFNIAQAYRLKGDCVEAIGSYKTYKRNFATAPNIEAVDKFIVDLEPCAKAQSAKPAHDTPEPVFEDRGATRRKLGLGVAGAGVVLVGTGIVFGVMAKSRSDAVTNGGDVANPQPFDPSLERAGKRYELLAIIAWSVGGAAVVGGGVLYVMGRNAERTRVSATPVRGGALIGWTSHF